MHAWREDLNSLLNKEVAHLRTGPPLGQWRVGAPPIRDWPAPLSTNQRALARSRGCLANWGQERPFSSTKALSKSTEPRQHPKKSLAHCPPALGLPSWMESYNPCYSTLWILLFMYQTPFVADFKQKHYQGHFEPRPVFVHPGVSHSPLKLHNLSSSHIQQDLLSRSKISHGTICESFNSTSLKVRLSLMESLNLS